MTPLNILAVKYAALLAIESSPTKTATNLDIKNLLRHAGFYATQQEVSELMQQAVQDLQLQGVNNGTYNVWSLPQTPATVATTNASSNTTHTTNSIQLTQTTDQYEYKKRDGTVIGGNLTPVTDNYWIVTNLGKRALYFDIKHTRDEVRQAYASIMKVDRSDTRAQRDGSNYAN